MPWDNADFYLLTQIKRHEALLDFLLYRIGNIQSIITQGGAGIMSGESDPNTALIKPVDTSVSALYQQLINGIPVHLWFWHVSDQEWK